MNYGMASVVLVQLPLDPADQLLICQLLLLVVDHAELVCLQLVLLQLRGLRHQVGQLDGLSTLGVVLDALPAHLSELVNGLIVDLSKQFLGAQRLVTNLLDPFKIVGQIALVFPKIIFNFLDQLIKEHLHHRKIILELLHYLVSDVIVHKQFVLLLSEGLTVYFALF
jgi:hypothetical protein